MQPTSTPTSAASGQLASTAPTSKIDEEAPEGIPSQELEAKMSSVQEALDRFDVVKVGWSRTLSTLALIVFNCYLELYDYLSYVY